MQRFGNHVNASDLEKYDRQPDDYSRGGDA
jgi:hypothetical protein